MRLVLAATLLVTTSTAMGQRDDFSKITSDDIDFCSDLQDVAIEVMRDRQSGVKFMDAIKVAKQEKDEYWQTIKMALVNSVYEIPVLPLESQQEEAIAIFGNGVAKGCFEDALEEKAVFEYDLLDEDASAQARRQQYISMIAQKVENNWLRPAATSEEQSCEVIVTQTMSGDVTDVQLQSCTSDKGFQLSVERAIRNASPLPLPSDPELFDRKIYFKFKPRS